MQMVPLRARIASLAGVFPLLLGVVVLAGWHLNVPVLIRIRPTFSPMVYNTALIFVVSGLGLVLASMGRLRSACVCGLVSIAVSTATLLAYYFGLDPGLDQIFMAAYIPSRIPGRMAPNTAVCFILFGFAMLFARDRSSQRSFALAVLGSLILSLAVVPLAGYGIGMPSAYTWGFYVTAMAIHTTVGFLSLGAGLIALAWPKNQVKGVVPAWVPVVAGIAVMTTATLLWQTLLGEEDQRIGVASQSAASNARARISTEIEYRLQALGRMAARLSVGETVAAWRMDARMYLAPNAPHYRAIWWTDAGFKPLQALPDATPAPTAVWPGSLSTDHGDPMAAFRLNGHASGFLIGTFDLKSILQQRAQDPWMTHNCVTLWESSAKLLETCTPRDSSGRQWLAEQSINLLEATWKLQVWPRQEWVRQQRSRLPHLVLLLGIVMGSLVALSIHLSRSARLRARDLLQQKELFQSTLETANDAFVCIDGNGIVLEWNRKAETIFGWLREQVTGKALADVIVPVELREAHQRGIARYAQTGESKLLNQTVEMLAMHRSGRQIPVELTIWAGVAPDGGRRLNAFLRDTSQRKEMEKEIEAQHLEILEQSRRAIEASRMKSEFLANMSHELRTPLNSIIGFSELLYDEKIGPVPEGQKDLLNDILTSSHHLLTLINGVLDLAKVEAGKMDFRPEHFNLQVLVKDVVGSLDALAAQKNIRIETSVHASCQEVFLDPSRLMQVLLNYLSNALKFTRAGEQIVVRATPEDAQHFRLEVEDTGIGIKAADLPRLFRSFQQLDDGPAKQHQGTGLGLALTKQLVEAQGGHVGVSSTPGQGSTFFAVLPMGTAEEDLRLLTGALHNDAGLASRRASRQVLVVDDDPAVLKLLQAHLSLLGIGAAGASGSQQALAIAAELKPDVVVLDLAMPDIDGLGFLRQFRATANGSRTPVFVWTNLDLSQSERLELEPLVQAIAFKRHGGAAAVLAHIEALLGTEIKT